MQKIREKFNSSAAAIVGDRSHDIEAARETGSLSVGVLYGYGGEEPKQADITINRCDELLDIFDRKLPVFAEILNKINQRQQADRPFILGITGIDGAGKSRFAAALRRYLDSRNYRTQIIHLDDFHNPLAVRYAGENQMQNYYHRSFNLDEIINKLLRPVHQKNTFSTRLPVLNPATDENDTEKEYSFNAETIVIFEGVFLLREELSPYLDYTVFLEIPFEESQKRAKQRDTDDIVAKYDTKYLPAQKKYLAKFPPDKHADIIIDNGNWEYPTIINIR